MVLTRMLGLSLCGFGRCYEDLHPSHVTEWIFDSTEYHLNTEPGLRVCLGLVQSARSPALKNDVLFIHRIGSVQETAVQPLPHQESEQGSAGTTSGDEYSSHFMPIQSSSSLLTLPI